MLVELLAGTKSKMAFGKRQPIGVELVKKRDSYRKRCSNSINRTKKIS